MHENIDTLNHIHLPIGTHGWMDAAMALPLLPLHLPLLAGAMPLECGSTLPDLISICACFWLCLYVWRIQTFDGIGFGWTG